MLWTLFELSVLELHFVAIASRFVELLLEARVLLDEQLHLLSRGFELERLTLHRGSYDESIGAGRDERDGYRSDHHLARADLGLFDPGAHRGLCLALELVLQLGRADLRFLFELDAKIGF